MTRKRLSGILQDEFKIDISCWEEPTTQGMTEDAKKALSNRIDAIKKYFDYSKTIKEITADTGISASEIHRLVARCLTQKEDGTLWGFSALIKNTHIKKNERRTEISPDATNHGLKGVFKDFLNKHPDIDEMIRKAIFKTDSDSVKVKGYKVVDIYKKMIKMCEDQKLYNEYPLNLLRSELNKEKKNPIGLRALYRYVEILCDNNYILYVKANGSKDAFVLASTTGTPTQTNPLPPSLYSVVEMDGHKIDGIFVKKLVTPEGDVIIKVLNRVWMIAIMEIQTKTILGYTIAEGIEYSQDDVMECIKNAIVPHQLMNFTIENFAYPLNGGFVSTAIPELQWAVFNELRCDNAKQHLGMKVRDLLSNQLNVNINYGPVNTPTRRPHIEKFFDIFEEEVFHKLANTTGSNPYDSRRDHPTENAIKYEQDLDELSQLIEVEVAKYNNTPQRGLYGQSPLEALKGRYNSGQVVKILKEYRRKDIELINQYDVVQVAGSKERGRRPFINYKYVTYTSDKLCQRYDLLKHNLFIEINPQDGRTVKAYEEKGGAFFDILIAHGKWGVFEHSFSLREELHKFNKSGAIVQQDWNDPTELYKVYLAHKLKQNNKKKKLGLKKNSKDIMNKEPNNTEQNDNLAGNTEFKDLTNNSDQNVVAQNKISEAEKKAIIKSQQSVELLKQKMLQKDLD